MSDLLGIGASHIFKSGKLSRHMRFCADKRLKEPRVGRSLVPPKPRFLIGHQLRH